jgi:hypothetical protein
MLKLNFESNKIDKFMLDPEKEEGDDTPVTPILSSRRPLSKRKLEI